LLVFSSSIGYHSLVRSIKFLGAAGTVTGSGYLLQASTGEKLLIDLGMFQGITEVEQLNYRKLELDGSELVGAILTHAHLDHCGRLPMIVSKGFRGKVYCTEPTAALAEIVMFDSAKIARHDRDKPTLYTDSDVDHLLSNFRVVNYHQEFLVGPFKVRLVDAGHILGSASVLVEEGGKSIIFSGDLGNSPHEIVKDMEYFNKADYVVMESTYGGRNHPPRDGWEKLRQEVNSIEKSGSTLLIPAFSLDRTQVLLYMLKKLKEESKIKKDTVVFMDGPMGIRATEVYREFANIYKGSFKEYSRNGDPFTFPGLEITMDAKKSKKISSFTGPKVIIAGAGMMSGGRILSHAVEYLPQKNARLLFVGYQADETKGRELFDGAVNLEIDEETVQVNAKITKANGMSGHTDQKGLLNWLSHIKGVRSVFLTHGDEDQRQILSKKITNVQLPKLNQETLLHG
jgi:metallo-beta-lactamase family protein